jgi:hypothetical protein
MKRDEVRRLRASSQRSTRVASELLPGPLGASRLREARFGGRSKAGLQMRVWRTERRPPRSQKDRGH